MARGRPRGRAVEELTYAIDRTRLPMPAELRAWSSQQVVAAVRHSPTDVGTGQ